MGDTNAIFRVETKTTKSVGAKSLGKAIKHLDKHTLSAEILHPELTQYNGSLKNAPTYKECLALAKADREKHNTAVDEWNVTHDKPKRRRVRSDASQFFECVLTFSPSANGKFSIKEWCKANQQFVKDEFLSRGCKLVRFDLHMDEATPHIHFICLAFNEKEQICTTRSILGNRQDLSKLQDRYAEAMEQFDLDRGYSRYKMYQSVAKRAAAELGVSRATPEQVQAYADRHGIELPRYRGHKPLPVWKAEQEQIGKDLEKKNTDLQNDYDNTIKEFAELQQKLEYAKSHFDDLVLDSDDVVLPRDGFHTDYER